MICKSQFRRARRIDGAVNALLAGPWGLPGRDRPGCFDGVVHVHVDVAPEQGTALTIPVGAAPFAVARAGSQRRLRVPKMERVISRVIWRPTEPMVLSTSR